MELSPFIFLGCALISLWIRRDPKIWGSLLVLSLASALYFGTLESIGLFLIFGWAILWFSYAKQPTTQIFIAIILLSYGFKLHVFPGYPLFDIVTNFHLLLSPPIVGLFPLALLVPLATTLKSWKEALFKGLWLTIAGIGVMAIAAILSGTTHWEFKLPSFAAERYLSNLILVAIPEEGFYRGFIQNELCRYFQHKKRGNLFALLLTSLIFTLAHIYWSPNIAILAFVFLASLLYGGVYLISKRIESAILCHFLLNFIHMTFFHYHAM